MVDVSSKYQEQLRAKTQIMLSPRFRKNCVLVTKRLCCAESKLEKCSNIEESFTHAFPFCKYVKCMDERNCYQNKVLYSKRLAEKLHAIQEQICVILFYLLFSCKFNSAVPVTCSMPYPQAILALLLHVLMLSGVSINRRGGELSVLVGLLCVLCEWLIKIE